MYTTTQIASPTAPVTQTRTDYVNGFVYVNNELDFFANETGRVLKVSGGFERQYVISDHLGNARISVKPNANNQPVILQYDSYYPFGLEMGGMSFVSSSENKYKYNGKEKQTAHNLGWYDYGARFYDPQVGRFFTHDRFSEKFTSNSTYMYARNNPILFIDINGDSAVVLNSPSGAHGAGHMAVLIQDKDNKYRLYSKNGTSENAGFSGSNNIGDERGLKKFNTPEDFLKSSSNPVENQKTGERKYNEGFLIPLTKTEDKNATGAALNELNKDYNVLTSNCANTVQEALTAAGKSDGSSSTGALVNSYISGGVAGLVGSIIPDLTPRLLYEKIKLQNNGTVIKP